MRACLIIVAALALILGASVGAPAHAQQHQPSLRINQLDTSAYPTIRAVVSALHENEAPVAGLTAGSFQAFEDGAAIAIDSVEPAPRRDDRLAVVLVIDASPSMEGPPLEAAKASAAAFVRGLRPQDEVAIFAFDGEVATVGGFTVGDRNALLVALADIQAGRGVALHEAAQTAAFVANASSAPRKAIVLLSAAADDVGGVTAEEALAVAGSTGVPVFGVALGARGDDDPFLQTLAATTGGQFRRAALDTSALPLAAISTLVQGQYVLTMTGTDGTEPRGELRILAEIDGALAGAVATFDRRDEAAPPLPAGDNTGASLMRRVVVAIGGVLVALLAVAGVAGVAYGGRRVTGRLREARNQHAVEQSNALRVLAQPLLVQQHPAAATPDRVAVVARASTAVIVEPGEPVPLEGPLEAAPAAEAPAAGYGRVVEKLAEGRGATFDLGRGIVIGSSPRESTLLLPEDPAIAPAHARIWLHDGKYMLHHTAGFRRRTLVNGEASEWCVLEHGDEIQVGTRTLIFEDASAPADAAPLQLRK